MADDFNLVAAADDLASIMSEDLEESVSGLQVLDWLALIGCTLRLDTEGDASTAYQLLLGPLELEPAPEG